MIREAILGILKMWGVILAVMFFILVGGAPLWLGLWLITGDFK